MLKLLRNQIDITRVPFSDRGSRLLINQYPGQSRLSIKLAERLISLQPGIHEYYNPETGEPPATSANMFGWTAAVFIELAIQATADSVAEIL